MAEKVSTFAKRLRLGLDMTGLTQAALSEMSRISKSSISRDLKGDWEGKQDAVYALAKALDVSEAWLMGYAVTASRSAATGPVSVPEGFAPLPELVRLPRVGRIACGGPITAEENLDGYDNVPASWHGDFTLVCSGASMLPRIQDGDVVVIRKQPEVENGEIAAVRGGSEATLKHVYLYPGYIELRPENPAFESIIKIGDAMNEVVIEGKAVGLCRRL